MNIEIKSQTIEIPADVIQQIVEKQIQEKLARIDIDTKTGRVLRSYIDDELVKSYVKTEMDKMAADESSILFTSMQREIQRHAENIYRNYSSRIENIFHDFIRKTLMHEDGFKFVEKSLTKMITQDYAFIQAVKTNILHMIPPRFKKIQKKIGTQAVDTLVQDTIKKYYESRGESVEPIE